MEDTHVEAGVTGVSFALKRISTDPDALDEATLLARNVDLTDANKLNFMRRAGWSEYFLQLVVPPFIVDSDPDVADEALFENYVARMQSEIPRELKEGLSRDMVGKTPQLVVNAPLRIADKIESKAGRLDVIVFSDREPDVIQIHRISSDNGRDPRLLLEEELEPLQASEWQAKSRGTLGADVEYLGDYLYASGFTQESVLNDMEAGVGGYLRFTVSFRNAPDRTWTTPY